MIPYVSFGKLIDSPVVVLFDVMKLMRPQRDTVNRFAVPKHDYRVEYDSHGTAAERVSRYRNIIPTTDTVANAIKELRRVNFQNALRMEVGIGRTPTEFT